MQDHKIRFRPHFKTHQSLEIGRWFRDYGITRITVSSVRMAQYFASDGWNDIMVAFPVNLLELTRINALATHVRLQLIAEDPAVIRQLDQGLQAPVDILLKMDVGTHRTGLDPQDKEKVDACVEAVRSARNLTWRGFVAHAGHTYRAEDITAMHAVYQDAKEALVALKRDYQRSGEEVAISFGDTPGASIMEDLSWIDEMRPGNFVFYDTMQEQIRSCTLDDVAIAMACPVVAVHPERDACVLYGGGIHFSKDFIRQSDGSTSFGTVVRGGEREWNAAENIGDLKSLSQEHGVATMDRDVLKQLSPGSLLFVLPVHSCMTAQCMGAYRDLQTGMRVDHFASAKEYSGN